MQAILWASMLWAWTAATPATQADIGVDPPMRWVSRLASMPDLCAPCSAGDQCESGVCALDGAGGGLCTQTCDPRTPCPDNFTCSDVGTTSICTPMDATVCPDPYYAPLNTFCLVPSSSNDPNLAISRNCDGGLTCFVFPSGYGACVSACSALDANQSCRFGQTCCFGTDANAYCMGSTPTQSVGGCFQVQQPGESCAQPDHSFCAQGSTCLYAQTASAARCYAECSDTTPCGTGGACATFQNVQVCCDVRNFNPNDISTCAPFSAVCKREVGVVCSSNDDCRLGLCFKNGVQAACSTSCVTDADCPGPNEDTNGDGTADGGSTCRTFGTEQRCWPVQGPAPAPACAVIKSDAQTTKGQGGCNCQQAQVWPLSALYAVGLGIRRRLRARRA